MRKGRFSIVMNVGESTFVIAVSEISGDAFELAAAYKNSFYLPRFTIYVVEGNFSWDVEEDNT